MLREGFEAGGWGMYPTFLFAVMLIGGSVYWAVRPRPAFVKVLWSLALLTLTMGALGFVSGTLAVAQYVKDSDLGAQLPRALVLGWGEATNNLATGLLGVVIALVAITVGNWRASRDQVRPAPMGAPATVQQ